MTPRADVSRHRRRHSLAWRVTKAFEHAGESRPVLSRTGPAWIFGLIGVVAEFLVAPVVLGVTIAVGVFSYLVLDTPITKIRAQQRPRFVSVRVLYLNTLIVCGFWLAVMFTFSAADPAVSSAVDQRVARALEVASTTDLRALVALKRDKVNKPAPAPAVGAESTWFDVFIHGMISALALNFILYGLVIARRRQRARRPRRDRARRNLRYDSMLGLFVDEDPPLAR